MLTIVMDFLSVQTANLKPAYALVYKETTSVVDRISSRSYLQIISNLIPCHLHIKMEIPFWEFVKNVC